MRALQPEQVVQVIKRGKSRAVSPEREEQHQEKWPMPARKRLPEHTSRHHHRHPISSQSGSQYKNRALKQQRQGKQE
jgi:hypothetical protein